VPYFAAAAVRGPAGWSGAELDLVDPDAAVSLLFVESDDSYLVILRLDDGEDLRIFSSDAAFADESRLGALLIGDIRTPAVEVDLEPVAVGASAAGGATSAVPAPSRAGGGYPVGDPLDDLDDVDALADEEADDEEPVADPDADADLLADLGLSARRLLALCARDGLLPADVTAEICQTIGCGDEVEELREA
jgi:putative tRNA adenosine deaminase-associated protein